MDERFDNITEILKKTRQAVLKRRLPVVHAAVDMIDPLAQLPFSLADRPPIPTQYGLCSALPPRTEKPDKPCQEAATGRTFEAFGAALDDLCELSRKFHPPLRVRHPRHGPASGTPIRCASLP